MFKIYFTWQRLNHILLTGHWSRELYQQREKYVRLDLKCADWDFVVENLPTKIRIMKSKCISSVNFQCVIEINADNTDFVSV